jgi:hypothetical protein
MSTMLHNMGTWDRWLRALVIAPAAGIGALLAGATTVLGVVLLVVAAIMAVTAVTGFCPLYRLLGISTIRDAAPEHARQG